MFIDRRSLVLGGLATLTTGRAMADWAKSADFARVLDGPGDPIERARHLGRMVRAGHAVEALARAAAIHAATRIDNRSPGQTGHASHALLGLAAAWRLAALLPGPRRAIPVIQAAVVVAQEAQRSPYYAGRFYLPPAPAPVSGPMQPALDAMDVSAAEAVLLGLPDTAARHALLVDIATTTLGHLGHGVIFVEHLHALARSLGLDPTLFQRTALRYLASFAARDDTMARARAASASGAPAPDPRVSRDRAVSLFLRLDGFAGFSSVHLVTACDAFARLCKAGGGDPWRLVAWLELFETGRTELGTLTVMPRPAAPALRGSSDADLAELASACGRGTVQHSVKLAGSTLGTGASARNACARYLATVSGQPDPMYFAIVNALGVPVAHGIGE